MKNLLLVLSLFFFTSSLFAQKPLQNFEELMTALKAGKSVKAVIYYGKCKLFSDGKEQADTINAIGGMQFDTYEFFDSSVFQGKIPSFVTTSETVLINHRKYGYVLNYVKIKVSITNSVEITARYLKPRKFSSKYNVVMDETFKGKIMDGLNNGGVAFFTN